MQRTMFQGFNKQKSCKTSPLPQWFTSSRPFGNLFWDGHKPLWQIKVVNLSLLSLVTFVIAIACTYIILALEHPGRMAYAKGVVQHSKRWWAQSHRPKPSALCKRWKVLLAKLSWRTTPTSMSMVLRRFNWSLGEFPHLVAMCSMVLPSALQNTPWFQQMHLWKSRWQFERQLGLQCWGCIIAEACARLNLRVPGHHRRLTPHFLVTWFSSGVLRSTNPRKIAAQADAASCWRDGMVPVYLLLVKAVMVKNMLPTASFLFVDSWQNAPLSMFERPHRWRALLLVLGKPQLMKSLRRRCKMDMDFLLKSGKKSLRMMSLVMWPHSHQPWFLWMLDCCPARLRLLCNLNCKPDLQCRHPDHHFPLHLRQVQPQERQFQSWFCKRLKLDKNLYILLRFSGHLREQEPLMKTKQTLEESSEMLKLIFHDMMSLLYMDHLALPSLRRHSPQRRPVPWSLTLMSHLRPCWCPVSRLNV